MVAEERKNYLQLNTEMGRTQTFIKHCLNKQSFVISYIYFICLSCRIFMEFLVIMFQRLIAEN